MVKIYTRKGDKGFTRLASGEKVSKSNIRIETYGELDNLNSYLGLIVSFTQELKIKKKFNLDINLINQIQNALFYYGSMMSCHSQSWKKLNLNDPPKIDLLIESRIDQLEKKLTPLRNFILPGGSTLASYIHLARNVCRLAERKTVFMMEEEGIQEVPREALLALNRLSDYLFVFSRYVNMLQKKKENIWKIKKK